MSERTVVLLWTNSLLGQSLGMTKAGIKLKGKHDLEIDLLPSCWGVLIKGVIEYCRQIFETCPTAQVSVIVVAFKSFRITSFHASKQSIAAILEGFAEYLQQQPILDNEVDVKGTIKLFLRTLQLEESDEAGRCQPPSQTRLVCFFPPVEKAPGHFAIDETRSMKFCNIFFKYWEKKNKSHHFNVLLLYMAMEEEALKVAISPPPSTISCTRFLILAPRVIEGVWDLAQRLYRLWRVRITNIPMKESETKGEYDVLMAMHPGSHAVNARSTTPKLRDGEVLGRETQGDSDAWSPTVVTLSWKPGVSKSVYAETTQCVCMHRATPLEPQAAPTVCLLKHMSQGKPVCLEAGTSEAQNTASPLFPFHSEMVFLTEVKGDLFVHCLPPPLTQPTISKSFDPRIQIFSALSRRCRLDNGELPLKSCTLTTPALPHSTTRALELASRCVSSEAAVTLLTIAELSSVKAFQRSLMVIIQFLCNADGNQDEDSPSAKAYEALTHIFNITTSEDCPNAFARRFNPETQREVMDTPQTLFADILALANLSAQPPTTPAHRRFAATVNTCLTSLQPQDDRKRKERDADTPPAPHARKPKKLVDVALDDNGRPVMPIHLNPSLTVLNIGVVVWDPPSFHSDKYIWPLGYKSTRQYTSMLSSDRRTVYTCEIHRNAAGNQPEFRITPADAPDKPITSSTASGAWSFVIKRVNEMKTEESGRKNLTTVSGPEYFGLAAPEIRHLVQQLPNARKCTKYQFQDIRDGGKVISVSPTATAALAIDHSNDIERDDEDEKPDPDETEAVGEIASVAETAPLDAGETLDSMFWKTHFSARSLVSFDGPRDTET